MILNVKKTGQVSNSNAEFVENNVNQLAKTVQFSY